MANNDKVDSDKEKTKPPSSGAAGSKTIMQQVPVVVHANSSLAEPREFDLSATDRKTEGCFGQFLFGCQPVLLIKLHPQVRCGLSLSNS